MSRSIHENRSLRHFEKKGAFDSQELQKKDRVKAQSREGLRSTQESASPTVESIPICIGNTNEFLFFPVSVDEIAHVLALLPVGAFTGISSIQLKDGKRYVNQEAHECELLDPFTSSKCYEVFPNIYIPIIRGVYSKDTGIVEIFAYIKHPETVPTTDQLLALRLQMLSTLVHEIAHHQDRTTRVARGRWRMDDESKAESFAENMAETWSESIIIPFLHGNPA